jgi:sialic acid synthase SpsE
MIDIIAEIGWNHMGDMDLAEKMIVSAKSSGATYAKFQTWSVDNLKSGSWDNDGRLDIYNKAELSDDDHRFLKECCDTNDIKFLTSCFSIKSVDLISTLTDAVKIPSTELNNLDLIRACSESFDRLFVSTGASTLHEVELAVDILNNANCSFTLLHCVSSYPCEFKNANMKRINDLKRYSINVGYSGHCFGIHDAIYSLEFGVDVIEKHFTTDRNLPGRDNQFAIIESELKELCSYVDNRDIMGMHYGIDYLPCETDMRENYRGRWDA